MEKEVSMPGQKKIDFSQFPDLGTTQLPVGSVPSKAEEEPGLDGSSTLGVGFYDIFDGIRNLPVNEAQLYGADRGTYKHNGVDFGVVKGTILRAPVTGTAVYSEVNANGSRRSTGRTVVITPSNNKNLRVIIGHFSVIDDSLSDGKPHLVAASQVLGKSGGVESEKLEGELTEGSGHVHISVLDTATGDYVSPSYFIGRDLNAKSFEVKEADSPRHNPGELAAPDEDNWLCKALGISGAALAGLLAVGFLTEFIQAKCWVASKKVDSDLLKTALITLSKVPGLKHIDWHDFTMYDDNARKAWFTYLKRADYDNRGFIVKETDQNYALDVVTSYPSHRLTIRDVDFDDTIIVKFDNGVTLYGVFISNYQNIRSNITDEPLCYIAGFTSDGRLCVAQEVPWNESQQ